MALGYCPALIVLTTLLVAVLIAVTVPDPVLLLRAMT